MKSNKTKDHQDPLPDERHLRKTIRKEKEELVSMFLANVSHRHLTEQFKRIDELNDKINKSSNH